MNNAATRAESAVIGAALVSEEARSQALIHLIPDDFANTKLKTIFSTIHDMVQKHVPVDAISIRAELEQRRILDRIGDDFLDELIDSVDTTANVSYYIKLVSDSSHRRDVMGAGDILKSLATRYDLEVHDVINDALGVLRRVEADKRSKVFRPLNTLTAPALADIAEGITSRGKVQLGMSTGFIDIDNILGGLVPGSLNIIAARPSMGKTTLALNMAQFGGAGTSPVLIFSIEMPAKQVVDRMIAAQSQCNMTLMKKGMLTAQEFKHVQEACAALSAREIYINDATALSAPEFSSLCRQFKMQHPELALVIVDYLQLMSSGDKRTEGRQQEVSDISRILKATARELDCPVIALSQLSRAAENRTDKKPQLADLRDSGAIEQDADTVMMLYREDYYSDHENSEDTDGKAEVRIAKNRNGGTGVATLTFRREITRFFNHGEGR